MSERDKRGDIISATWDLIAERGFEAVSIRHVATQAGVSAGSVQHYFTSKSALVRVSCLALVNQARETFMQQSARRSVAQRLRLAVTHPLRLTAAGRPTSLWFAYMTHGIDDPHVASLLAEAKRQQEADVATILVDTGVAQGRREARRLLAIADGVAVRVLVGDLAPAEARAVLSREIAVVLESSA